MASKQKIRIILVDDNDIDIIVNTKLLKIANITSDVISFSGCNEIINFFSNSIDNTLDLKNVILMDIQMPDYNGFETIEMIEEKFPQLSDSCLIFMLSSSIDRGDIKRAESNPKILKVLEKPLDVYQLKSLIDEILD